MAQKTVIKPTLSAPGRVAVTSCAYNSDGRLIAAGLMDGTIQVGALRGVVLGCVAVRWGWGWVWGWAWGWGWGWAWGWRWGCWLFVAGLCCAGAGLGWAGAGACGFALGLVCQAAVGLPPRPRQSAFPPSQIPNPPPAAL